MGLVFGILKWLFPNPKGSHDYKLIIVFAASMAATYHYSAIRAQEVVKSAKAGIMKDVKVADDKINAQIQSQNAAVLSALENISTSQTEIKDNLKSQDQKLWQLSRDVKSSN